MIRNVPRLAYCVLLVMVGCATSIDELPDPVLESESNEPPAPPGAKLPARSPADAAMADHEEGEEENDASGTGPGDAGKDGGDAGKDGGDAGDAGKDAPSDATIDVNTDGGFKTAIYGHVGANQSFVVPPGVTTLSVKLWGAAGAGTSGAPSAGGGGFVKHGALPVSPGETLVVIVGGGGRVNPGLAVGGFGGGGNGSNDPTWAWSGSGGGRSAILRGTTELVTAGGGGGTGYPTASGAGGSGCALASGAGGDATGSGFGGGAGLLSGGGGGTGNTMGNPGSARQGGHGLTGGLLCSGGGGGGYFGGGSGGHTVNVISGAGGGGSCFVPAGGTSDGTGGLGDPDFNGTAGRPVTASNGNHGRVVIRW